MFGAIYGLLTCYVDTSLEVVLSQFYSPSQVHLDPRYTGDIDAAELGYIQPMLDVFVDTVEVLEAANGVFRFKVRALHGDTRCGVYSHVSG